jgi:hypothetical protein
MMTVTMTLMTINGKMTKAMTLMTIGAMIDIIKCEKFGPLGIRGVLYKT